jgi:hypothetical protein
VAESSQFCPSCSARVMVPGALCTSCTQIGTEPVTIWVEGNDASDVSKVMRELFADAAVRHESVKLRSPWVSGTFYLMALAIVVALLLAAGNILPIWTLPLVIIGGVLLLAVVGALQLRQDDRLSDQGFVKLMSETLVRLPVVWSRRISPPSD